MTKVTVEKFLRSNRRTGKTKGKIDYKIKVQKVPYKFMCWNVRNMGTISRAGVVGRGVHISDRLNQVAETIKKHDVDTAILLETGPKAQSEVCDYLNQTSSIRYGWTSYVSDETNGETYVMVQRKDNGFSIGWGEIVGQKDKYRGGVLIKISADVSIKKDNQIYLLALHAPAPNKKQSLKVRKEVITNCILEAQKIIPDDHLILCGDLNIMHDEFDDFKKYMEGIEGIFKGPYFDEQGTKPIFTSLRRFTTILKTDGDTESQPYDQVWELKNKKSNSKLLLSGAVAIEPYVYGDHLNLLRNWLKASFDEHEKAVKGFDPQDFGTINKKQHKEVTLWEDSFLKDSKQLLRFQEMMKRSKQDYSFWLPLTDGCVKYCNDRKSTLPPIKKGMFEKDFMLWKGILKGISNPNIDGFNPILRMLVSSLEAMLTGGSEGINDLLGPGVFEFCVSDHIPVVFVVNIDSIKVTSRKVY
jgi:exonuclease III